MNLGRSESMAWISCLGIISTWGSGAWGGVETDTNQALWKQRDYTSLLLLPPSSHNVQPAIIISPFLLSLFCYSFAFCCLFAPRLKTLRVLNSITVRVCVCVLSVL